MFVSHFVRASARAKRKSLPADFCTAFTPDSEEIEPTSAKHAGETF